MAMPRLVVLQVVAVDRLVFDDGGLIMVAMQLAVAMPVTYASVCADKGWLVVKGVKNPAQMGDLAIRRDVPFHTGYPCYHLGGHIYWNARD